MKATTTVPYHLPLNCCPVCSNIPFDGKTGEKGGGSDRHTHTHTHEMREKMLDHVWKEGGEKVLYVTNSAAVG